MLPAIKKAFAIFPKCLSKDRQVCITLNHKVQNNSIENQPNYYLGLCEPTMKIIENEGDCLVTVNFVSQLGNETFYAECCGFVCLCMCVVSLWRIKTER